MTKTRKYSRKYKRGGVPVTVKATVTDANLFGQPTSFPSIPVDKKAKVEMVEDLYFYGPENTKFKEAAEGIQMGYEDKAEQKRRLDELLDEYNRPMDKFNLEKCVGPLCTISGGRKTSSRRRLKSRKYRKSRRSRKH